PLTQAKTEILPPNLTMVGVRFWPGAATSLLVLPADELVDQIVPFGDGWGGGPDLPDPLGPPRAAGGRARAGRGPAVAAARPGPPPGPHATAGPAGGHGGAAADAVAADGY